MDPNAVTRVLVVGAGTMGNGIAQVFARAGIDVSLVDVDQKTLDRAMDRVESGLKTLVEYGSVSEKEMARIMKRIQISTDLEATAKDVDFAWRRWWR